jgi:hypothetical protein
MRAGPGRPVAPCNSGWPASGRGWACGGGRSSADQGLGPAGTMGTGPPGWLAAGAKLGSGAGPVGDTPGSGGAPTCGRAVGMGMGPAPEACAGIGLAADAPSEEACSLRWSQPVKPKTGHSAAASTARSHPAPVPRRWEPATPGQTAAGVQETVSRKVVTPGSGGSVQGFGLNLHRG